jgi:hypothetical protein
MAVRSTELPFRDGQWRLALGLKPLPLETWIDIGEDFVEQLTRKSELLEQHYDEVFASLPGSQSAQQEVLDLLVAHLLHYFPQHYQQQGEWLINQMTGQRWCRADFAEPLDLAARLVQEDLCLMLPSDGYRLSAASVCFPSRWRLAEKIGLPVSAIHQPVPDYDQKLERPVDQFFERLKPDYPGYRLNWSLVDSPELFLQSGHGRTTPICITAENAGKQLWLRIERQTLRRLSISNGILFTIRTRIHSLSSLTADPIIAKDLAAAIQKMPPQMQQYKSILPFRSALLEYLRRCHQ